jgi:hypothetical protein
MGGGHPNAVDHHQQMVGIPASHKDAGLSAGGAGPHHIHAGFKAQQFQQILGRRDPDVLSRNDADRCHGARDVLLRASGSNHRDLRQFNRLFGIRHRITADACADHQKYGVQATPAFGVRHPFPHSHTRDCVMEWVQDGAVTCSRLPSATRFRPDTLEGVDPVIDPGRSPGLRAGFLQSAFPGDRPSDICLR